MEHDGRIIAHKDIQYENRIFGYPVARLELPQGKSTLYILESDNYPIMSLAMYRLYPQDSYNSYNNIEKTIIIGILFLLAVTLIYSLILSLMLKNKVLMAYSFYVVACFNYIIIYTGRAHALWDSDMSSFHYYGAFYTVLGLSISGVVFCKVFFNTQNSF